MNHSPLDPVQQKEPSVLDYLKAKLKFWSNEVVELPPLPKGGEAAVSQPDTIPPTTIKPSSSLQLNKQLLLLPGCVLLALLTQLSFEHAAAMPGLLFGVGALVVAAWSYQSGAVTLAGAAPAKPTAEDGKFHLKSLLVGSLLALLAFMAFGGNRFTFVNLALWCASMGFVLWAVWPMDRSIIRCWRKAIVFLKQTDWKIPLRHRRLLWLAIFLIALFFRIYQLNQVVPEMVSDHAEKLLDVYDVLQGQRSIFFPRNTGREGLQMYLTVASASIFGTGVSFLSLKIGTAVVGLLMLPYMYLLGREIGNRWVGLLAMFLSSVAYWPNVLARVALRFILYPAFLAPVLYHLLRGLRQGRRTDFIWAGLFLGIGLHGYTPFRIVPLLVLLAGALFWLHDRRSHVSRRLIFYLSVLILLSLIMFLPLARYWVEYPEAFGYRAFSRLAGVERDLAGPVWLIFLSNLWNGLRMLNWNAGNIWVVSIPNRPALDVVSGAFFLLGVIWLLLRYLAQRRWQDVFLLLAVPVLMMPSVLSLAYPDENPALNRAGGVMVAAYVIAALALEAVLRWLWQRAAERTRPWLAGITTICLLLVCASQNYHLVFVQYQQQYRQSAWNTSEIGAVISQFANTVGNADSAWVVAYPHWVDNRLVGINAGFPTKNYEIWPTEIANTLELPAPKMFLYNPQDETAAEVLRQLYPQGAVSRYVSEQENKDFHIFFIPAGE